MANTRGNIHPSVSPSSSDRSIIEKAHDMANAITKAVIEYPRNLHALASRISNDGAPRKI